MNTWQKSFILLFYFWYRPISFLAISLYMYICLHFTEWWAPNKTAIYNHQHTLYLPPLPRYSNSPLAGFNFFPRILCFLIYSKRRVLLFSFYLPLHLYPISLLLDIWFDIQPIILYLYLFFKIKILRNADSIKRNITYSRNPETIFWETKFRL